MAMSPPVRKFSARYLYRAYIKAAEDTVRVARWCEGGRAFASVPAIRTDAENERPRDAHFSERPAANQTPASPLHRLPRRVPSLFLCAEPQGALMFSSLPWTEVIRVRLRGPRSARMIGIHRSDMVRIGSRVRVQSLVGFQRAAQGLLGRPYGQPYA